MDAHQSSARLQHQGHARLPDVAGGAGRNFHRCRFRSVTVCASRTPTASTSSSCVEPILAASHRSFPPSVEAEQKSRHQQHQMHLPSQSHVPLGTAERRSRGGLGGNDPSPDPGPTPPNQQQEPNGSPDGPDGGGMSMRLRYWILLLAEYGGLYGTAAVIIAALTHVDPFGGLHWDTSDVALGVGLMVPALIWDAVVGLPDWTTRQEDAEAVVRLFVDPELLKRTASKSSTSKSNSKDNGADVATGTLREDAGTSSVSTSAAGELGSAAASAAVTAVQRTEAAAVAPDGGDRSTSGSDASSSSGSGAPSGALWAAAQRLRMALELMQESSIRNNPGARLTTLQEAAVIAVAVTADEMLYRAVVLTLFGRWLRDRFYEAGAEDVVTLGLPLPAALHLPSLGVDTAALALWVALGFGVAAGAVVFAGKAWQEATFARRLRALQVADQEVAAKALKKQRLMGQHITEEEVREEVAKQARVQAAHASLVASIGVQGALVWVLEGVREVYQVAAAGAAFIATDNLAAPLAGSLVVQALVCTYQRLGMRRSMQRRAEVVARRRQLRVVQQGSADGAAEAVGMSGSKADEGGAAAAAERTAVAAVIVEAAPMAAEEERVDGKEGVEAVEAGMAAGSGSVKDQHERELEQQESR